MLVFMRIWRFNAEGGRSKAVPALSCGPLLARLQGRDGLIKGAGSYVSPGRLAPNGKCGLTGGERQLWQHKLTAVDIFACYVF